MRIEVKKNLVVGALNALGKVVCRTSPVEAYRSLKIEGKNDRITFQTVGLDEVITYKLPVEGVEEFTAIVNFDDFRTVVRACRNKSVAIECEDGEIRVDHVPLRTIETEWPEEHHETRQFEVAELPQNFVGALATVAPIVDRNAPRQVLRGIHLCKNGVVVTNGKELLNIEMPLNLAPLTIPFPHALLAPPRARTPGASSRGVTAKIASSASSSEAGRGRARRFRGRSRNGSLSFRT